MDINIKTISDFQYGIINTLEDSSIPRGASSNSLNWITEGDSVSLRRGSAILGNEITGAGIITGIYRAKRSDGTEILYRKRGQKLEYLLSATWTEIGTNVFGSSAVSENASFAEFHSLAGDELFINSPNGTLIKIMLANPASYAVMYDSSKNFKGYIKIKQNRMMLWGYTKSPNTYYLSYIDDVVENKTDVSAENVGTGDGSEKTFTDTLAFKGAGAKRTCFAIVATDGTETFADNFDGTLTGDKGGTGTINYMSGAISLTFNTAPAGSQALTCNYSWEDSTDAGICDFTYSATRVAGEGSFFPQNDGGPIQNVYSYGNSEYCVHESKTWVVTLTLDDTNATNLIYREKVGMPSKEAGVATGNGIYFVDTSDDKDYQIKILTLNQNGDVVPESISKQLLYNKKKVGIDLSDYLFNKSFGWEWGDYILFTCRTSDFTQNNRVLLYHKQIKSIDVLEYYVNGFAEYDGTLISADSMGYNVFTLFSGYDDDDSLINNYWEGNDDNLDFDGLKKVKKKIIQGSIGPDQKIKVSANIDNGGFVEIGTIRGDGDYVDKGQKVNVGSVILGSKEVGGGGDGITAYNYERELSFNQDKFDRVKMRFEAVGLGYFSISSDKFWDLRVKSRKRPTKYRN